MKKLWVTIAIAAFLVAGGNTVFGWGRGTHWRMTYWAWKHAQLSASSGTVKVRTAWNLDSLKNTLKLKGTDMLNFVVLLGGTVRKEATFTVDTTVTISASTADSALFREWGGIPDDFDETSEILINDGPNIGHMYVPAGLGWADGLCKFFFDKACSVAKANLGKPESLRVAYAYLALAAHYLEDAGFPVHNEKNYLNPKDLLFQLRHHGPCEDWIGDPSDVGSKTKKKSEINWYKYFDDLADTCSQIALPVCDPVMAVHSLAWEGSWDCKKFRDAWIKEAQYCKTWSDWDDTVKWEKELGVTKTKSTELVKKWIQTTQPRVVGLFWAFKRATGMK